ncbi:MAG: hypothetical protein IPJ16_13095 [Bacteroidales bacterium]|nr:hypothetical protein [Bacteroidales bacterium]
MAKFKAGESGNPAGRKPGAINKVAKPVKAQLSSFLNEKLTELPALWDKLTARDRVALLKDLFPYFLPKLQNIEAHLEYDRLTDEGLKQIATDILNSLQDDTTN